jgi:hypothetical protein
MNVPISALDIAEIVYESRPGGFSIGEIEKAMTVVKLIAAAKSIAIDQLEVTIKEVRDQNTALQAHNTELLLRARKAEGEVKELQVVFDLYTRASPY